MIDLIDIGYSALMAMLFLIPVLSVSFFIFSLISYCIAKKRNREEPGRYSKGQMRLQLVMLILSSVTMALLLMVMIGVIFLVLAPISFM